MMETMIGALDKHAAALASARLSSSTLNGTELASALDGDVAAYALQRRVNDALSADLGPVVGYKIGLTSDEQRRQIGVAEPVFGAMHAERRYAGRPLVVGLVPQPIGVECEVAFTLGEDLPATGAPFDRARVRSAIESIHAAIEVVQNRFATLPGTPVVSLIADAALHYGFALGSGIAGIPERPVAMTGALWLGDRKLAAGDMRVMYRGDPLEALVWLANKRASLGLSLAAGNVVLCGSFVPIQWIDPGALHDGPTVVRADFGGALPSCELVITL